eukprot:scaffold235722_cov33-Tisochrysis_lutea.AAC.4
MSAKNKKLQDELKNIMNESRERQLELQHAQERNIDIQRENQINMRMIRRAAENEKNDLMRSIESRIEQISKLEQELQELAAQNDANVVANEVINNELEAARSTIQYKDIMMKSVIAELSKADSDEPPIQINDIAFSGIESELMTVLAHALSNLIAQVLKIPEDKRMGAASQLALTLYERSVQRHGNIPLLFINAMNNSFLTRSGGVILKTIENIVDNIARNNAIPPEIVIQNFVAPHFLAATWTISNANT